MANYINPFNFVPLGSGMTPYERKESSYTGVIEYTLETKTPLFIPNTSNDHALKPEEFLNKVDGKFHHSYEFFSYADLSKRNQPMDVNELPKPVIPGSEIRGMLRANYEILSNSCLSAIDEKDNFSRRSTVVFQPGLIKREKNEEYGLYEADDCLWRAGKNGRWRYPTVPKGILEGDKVKFEITPRKNREGNKKIPSLADSVIKYSQGKPAKGEEIGYLIKGMNPKGDCEKHCYHIFVKQENKNRIANVDISILDTVLEMYKNNDEDGIAYKEYREQWELFKKGGSENEYFPVYYSTVNNRFYMLSPASITRELYQYKVQELIGDYHPCKDADCACPACKLFGTLNTDKDFKIVSRVRMSDLQYKKMAKNETEQFEPADVYESIVMLQELAEPKTNNMEFYLKRPADDAVYWTPDYYVTNTGRVIPYNNKIESVINGRKFYWHALGTTCEDAKTTEQTVRNHTVRPVGSGVQFRGKIYFDRISKEELNRLYYLVQTGDEEELSEKLHGYKLGSAKPLGFGSVVLHVDQVKLRRVTKDSENHTIKYTADTTDEEYTEADCNWDEMRLKQFEIMTRFDLLDVRTRKDQQIIYSYPKKNDEIYKWFTENHNPDGLRRSKRKDMIYQEYLSPLMPVFKSTDGMNNDLEKDFLRRYSKRAIVRREAINDVEYDGRVTKVTRTTVWIQIEGVKGIVKLTFDQVQPMLSKIGIEVTKRTMATIFRNTICHIRMNQHKQWEILSVMPPQ